MVGFKITPNSRLDSDQIGRSLLHLHPAQIDYLKWFLIVYNAIPSPLIPLPIF